MFDALFLRLRSVFSRKAVENELDDELRFHFDELIERHVREGATVEEARRRASLEFGGIAQLKEECRDARGTQFLDSLCLDLRYCARMLRKSPAFTAIAVLTLALGIGANTTIFSVLESVLLRPLPVSHPEQLAALTDLDEHGVFFGSHTGERSLLAYSEFEYLRDHNDVFSGLMAADSDLPSLEIRVGSSSTGGGQKQEARVKLVSGAYFHTLGVRPAAGRTFGSDADRARRGAPVAVVSYSFWRGRFGLNPAMLGQSIQIHNASFEIIGVAPPGFFGETVGQLPDVWVPMTMQDAVYPGRDYLSPSPQGLVNEYEWLQVLGRLRPGVSLAQAKARINVQFMQCLQSVAAGVDASQAGRRIDQRVALKPASGGSSTLRRAFGRPLEFLMALVGLVLLIACANVANLLLARGAARQKEFAMRLAIGADRRRLIRQLLTESLILSVLGAMAGVCLSLWGQRLLIRMVSRSVGAFHLDLQPDWRVLAFTAAVTVFTAILFGLIPAIRLTRLDLTPALKSTTLQIDDRSLPVRFPIAKLVVVAQVSVTLIVLAAAGLFVRSLSRLSEVHLGYNRDNLLLFRVDASTAGARGAAATRLYEQLLDNVAALPGVRAVTLSGNGLFMGSDSGDPITVEGYVPKSTERVESSIEHVGPNYFSTLGVPILMGREIDAGDANAGLRPAVINESFAKQFFPNSNPLGKLVRDTYAGNPADTEIVGVVSDSKFNDLREPSRPRLYAPILNPIWDQPQPVFEVRTFADPTAIGASVRRAVQATSATIPPIDLQTMTGLVDDSVQTDRFIERLSESFGLLAAVLGAIGLYGVMAYGVARRTREIGIRLALGAEPGEIRGQILRETVSVALVGIAFGVPAALIGTHLVRGMVFGIGFADPVAIGFAAILLLGVAVLAGSLPARRASLVDPSIALRNE